MTPLAGIRVLDLSRLLPGPFATLVLADLGAEVDKIEDTAGGDYLRVMPPHVTGGEGVEQTSSIFLALNRNKRSAVIDLKKPEARDAFLKLIKTYDVLLETFRPGVLDRLGLSYATLQEANPRLVICAISGYGQTGPLAQRAGHDLNYLARAGVLGQQGPAAGPPQLPGFQLADVSGALYAVIGIMARSSKRARTNAGKIVDVAMIETAMPFAVAGFGMLFGEQKPQAGSEALTGGIAPYQTYATKDARAMALASLEPKFWLSFCAGIQRQPGHERPRSRRASGRAEGRARRGLRGKDAGRMGAVCKRTRLLPRAGAVAGRGDGRSAPRRAEDVLRACVPWGNIPQMRTPLTTPDRAHHRAAEVRRAHRRGAPRRWPQRRRDLRAPQRGRHTMTPADH